MKDNKKISSLILVLVLMITAVISGTFAYWQWITSTEQQTLVNVSLTDDAKMYIDFPAETLTNLYPTSDCDPRGTSSWVTTITVDNGTGVLLSPQFRLKVKIEDKNNTVITNTVSEVENLYKNDHPNRYYIKYAVTSENGSCDKPLFSGRFDRDPEDDVENQDGWYDSELITTFDDETGFPIVSSLVHSGVSFFAKPNTQTTQKFKVWIWLDKDYVSITHGTESTDIMQDAKVTVSWSENSELLQVQREYQGEAVAIYSSTDNSLRFYRDSAANVEALVEGTTSTYNGLAVTNVYTGFENTVLSSIYEVPWANGTNVKKIIFEDYIYPISTAKWFPFGVEAIDLAKLDTSKVTDMNEMFRNAGLSNLDLNSLDTSNVTNMQGMFAFTTISNLDLSGWDTSNVTNMMSMFQEANVTNLDLSAWDTSNVTDMSYMFRFAYNITGLDLSGWDTSNVTNMSSMFEMGSIGNSIDLRGWNVCNVTDYSNFSDGIVGTIVTPNFGTGAKCTGLVDGDAYAVVYENVMDGRRIEFTRAETAITADNWTNYVTNYNESDGDELVAVYTGFEDAAYTSASEVPWHEDLSSIRVVYTSTTVYPKSTSYWFADFYSEVTLSDFAVLGSGFNPMRLTDMSYMFANFATDGDAWITLNDWDVSNVINMSHMFEGITGRGAGGVRIVLNNWNSSKVADMSYMFKEINGGSVGVEILLDNIDTSNVTNMSYMFADTANAEGTNSNFYLELNNIDTSNVTNMDYMFNNVSNMLSLDLRSWNVCRVGSHNNFTNNNNILQPNWGMSC